ncbi:MAG: hypothetical protein Q8N90_03240 [bacterium]|nr:hypothetical protein [bacterium]
MRRLFITVIAILMGSLFSLILSASNAWAFISANWPLLKPLVTFIQAIDEIFFGIAMFAAVIIAIVLWFRNRRG